MQLTFGNARVLRIFEQVHSGRHYIIPKLAVGNVLTSNVAAWTMGAYVEFLSAAALTQTVYITGIIVYQAALNVDYVIDVAMGSAGSEDVIASAYFSIESVAGAVDAQKDKPSQEISFSPPLKILGSTRISMRCADNAGGNTCRARLRYKT